MHDESNNASSMQQINLTKHDHKWVKRVVNSKCKKYTYILENILHTYKYKLTCSEFVCQIVTYYPNILKEKEDQSQSS